MGRDTSLPFVTDLELAQTIQHGGTSATTTAKAAVNLSLARVDMKDQDGGVLSLDPTGKIPSAKFPNTGGANKVNLDGNLTVYPGTTNLFKVTDYDSFRNYTVSAGAGTVSISGDIITYVAPNSPQITNLTVNGRQIVISVNLPAPARPTISTPVDGSGSVGPSITVVSSPFQALGDNSTHLNTDWQLATDSGFTAIVAQSLVDTVNKTTWPVNPPQPATTYYLRVRYRGSNGNNSQYSPTVTFTTRASFAPNAQESTIDVVSGSPVFTSVSITSDGSRVATTLYGAGSDTGYLYVFSRTNGIWAQEFTLSLTDRSGFVGASPNIVCLSQDGVRCVIACVGTYNGSNQGVGAVQIYSRSGTTWTQETVISSPVIQAGTGFGQSISIDNTATRMAVGSLDGNSAVGAMYIYTRSGANWTLEQKITNGTSPNQYFGEVVTISGDGLRAAARKPSDNNIYIYVRTGVTWAFEASVSSGNPGMNELSDPLDFDSTGVRLFAGATNGGTSQGSVRVFVRAGTTWSTEATLVADDGVSGDFFGIAVSVSADGSVLAVTRKNTPGNPNGANAGWVYLYKRVNSTWTQQGSHIQSTTPYAASTFGAALALRSDGFQMVATTNTPTAGHGSMIYSYM